MAENIPAFPKAGLDPWQNAKSVHTGMTLRDYFAAKAMQSFMAMEKPPTFSTAFGTEFKFDSVARDAYKMANAMLKAREE